MPEPDSADDGAARLKVLIGGVLLLFALTLAGLVFVLTRAKTPPEPIAPAPVPRANIDGWLHHVGQASWPV